MKYSERYTRKAAVFAAFLFLFLSLATAASASVSVSPVRVHLGDEDSRAVVRVANHGDASQSYQVEVVSWSQNDREREVYSPTDNVLAVPPLFTLQPGEEQLVRVGMLEPADANTESAYRMFITEIASQDADEDVASGISMRVRIGVPVFVAPAAVKPAPSLQLVDLENIDGLTYPRLRNSGNVHVKVLEVRHRASNDAEWVSNQSSFYLLAGQTGLSPFALPQGHAAGSLVIRTENHGSMHYELPGIQ